MDSLQITDTLNLKRTLKYTKEFKNMLVAIKLLPLYAYYFIIVYKYCNKDVGKIMVI